MSWVYLVIGFVMGMVAGFIGCSLVTGSKRQEYEDKLWELEKERMKMEYENRK